MLNTSLQNEDFEKIENQKISKRKLIKLLKKFKYDEKFEIKLIISNEDILQDKNESFGLH